MKEKIKTISKYACNLLCMVNAILLGLGEIWNIPYYNKISASIIVITGVCGAYLTKGKFFDETNGEEVLYGDELPSLGTEGEADGTQVHFEEGEE